MPIKLVEIETQIIRERARDRSSLPYRATASRQTDGFGFQAMLFTAPPT